MRGGKCKSVAARRQELRKSPPLATTFRQKLQTYSLSITSAGLYRSSAQHSLVCIKKTQVYRHNVLTTWNRLLLDDDTAADAAARSFVVSGCKAGCERPEFCYNDGGIYTV